MTVEGNIYMYYLLYAPLVDCSFDHFLKVWQTLLSLPLSSSVCLTVSLPAYILLWLPRPLPLCQCPVYVLGADTLAPSALWRGFCIRASSLSAQAVRRDKARIQSAASETLQASSCSSTSMMGSHILETLAFLFFFSFF